ncbi:putative quinol monooxygenase [Ferrimonas gelatinilytica]|uniref:Quinol monooxygenase n=1 Tax=Ferrimonas gelatinilytica TaxID=1255257 RepID=A0ABP9S689_9GAMM
MIHIVTTVELLPGCREKFLNAFNETVPQVKAEQGCLAYAPMVDIPSGLPTQGALRPDTVTVVETWESMEALHAHVTAPHMASFREAAKAYVRSLSHQVLQPA